MTYKEKFRDHIHPMLYLQEAINYYLQSVQSLLLVLMILKNVQANNIAGSHYLISNSLL